MTSPIPSFLVSICLLSMAPICANGQTESTQSDSAAIADPVARSVGDMNYILIDKETILAIAQVNPMAAGVLRDFLKDRHFPTLNILRGQASDSMRPTAATVDLMLAGVKDKAAYEKSMRPFENSTHFARTRWSSRRVEEGLEVTFASEEIDRDGSVVSTIYQPISIVLRNSVPTSLIEWRTN